MANVSWCKYCLLAFITMPHCWHPCPGSCFACFKRRLLTFAGTKRLNHPLPAQRSPTSLVQTLLVSFHHTAQSWTFREWFKPASLSPFIRFCFYWDYVTSTCVHICHSVHFTPLHLPVSLSLYVLSFSQSL